MADSESLSERVSTVERAVTDGDHDLPNADTLVELESRVSEAEDRLEALEDRTTELEAATQALRGYVGSIRSVNEDVQQRADTALATVERLEARLDDEGDRERSGRADQPAPERDRTRPEQPRSRPGRSQSAAGDPAPTPGGSEFDERAHRAKRRSGIEPPTTVGGEPDGGGGSAGTPGLLARIRALL